MRRALDAVLVLAAAISVLVGLRNGLLLAPDFKIGLARRLAAGLDPYAVGADYGHLAYLLLAVLAPLDDLSARFVWAGVNIAAGISAALVVARAFHLDGVMRMRLVLMFLASTPFRVAVGNAQVSLVLLVAASLLLLPPTRARTMLSGVAYFKWTFAAPLGLFMLARRGWRDFGLWTVPAGAGFVGYAALTGRFSAEAVLAPVLRRADNPNGLLEWSGHGDLMTVLGLSGVSDRWNLVISSGLLVVLSVALARTFRSDRLAVAAACGLSLPLVFHLPYDYVFLLPALAAGFERRREVKGRLLIGVCAIEFFADAPLKALRTIDRLLPDAISGQVGLMRAVELTTDLTAWPLSLPGAIVHLVVLASGLLLLFLLDRSDPHPARPAPIVGDQR
jgi:hypothetical protein